LPFAELPFQNVHAERVEQLALNGAFQRPRAVDRVVAFLRDPRLRRIAQLDPDLLLLETGR
jgi:hypothetical protein